MLAMKPVVLSFTISALLVFASASAAAPPDFIVSTHGDDAWSGTWAEPKADRSDGPLASVQRAVELVARLRRQDPQRNRPVIVVIRGGTYLLEQPIVLGPAVSGTEKSPTIFQAYGDEHPIFSGGRQITGWHVSADGRWRVELPDVKSGKWNFAQLFVGDGRRYRPRLPNRGYYQIAKQLKPTPEAANKGCNQFEFKDEEIRPDWVNRDDVEVLPFHEWAISRMHIAEVHPQEHRIVFTGHTQGLGGWAAFNKGYRYLVENGPDPELSLKFAFPVLASLPSLSCGKCGLLSRWLLRQLAKGVRYEDSVRIRSRAAVGLGTRVHRPFCQRDAGSSNAVGPTFDRGCR